MAGQFKQDKPLFDKTAIEWTAKYANPEALEKVKIKQLTDMGFTEEQAREALVKTNWDENQAINVLIGG